MRLPDPKGPVAVDIETSGLHPDDGARVASVGLAWFGEAEVEGAVGPVETLALPFDQGMRDKFPAVQLDLLEQEDPNLGVAEWAELLDWLEEQKLVFHNAKYDLTMLRAGTRHWPGRNLLRSLEWDTMVASSILDPRQPEALEAAAARAGLDGKASKEDMERWLKSHGFNKNRLDLVPWGLIEPYVTTDAEQTIQLYFDQWSRVTQKEEGDPARLEREHQLLRTLARMEWRGVAYDATRSMEAAEAVEAAAAELEAKVPFECTVPGAKRWFFDEQGLIPDRLTEKRQEPVLDDEQVRAWIAQGIEWAAEYAQVAKARRAVSMWYRGYPEKIGPDGRLRTAYKQTRVKSGRMSVERVQLQALPKGDKYSAVGSDERLAIYEGVPDVRDLLQAKGGHGLWSLDLSQAELRVAAEYSRCQPMLELLAQGEDIHGVTTQEVLEVARDDPFWKQKRDIAKRLTFGSIFQIGAQTFQATLSKLADIHLPIEECQAYVNRWRQMYPQYTTAYRKAERKAKRDGWVWLLPRTDLAMKSYFGERDWEHTAWNRMVQGSLAEFFKIWMVEAERQAPGSMILTIHDSLLLELPLDEGDAIAAKVARRGSAMATDLFMRPESGVVMPVDTDRWDQTPPDKASKEDDQYQGVSGW